VGDIKELAAPSGAARFFFVTDPDGYKIEVLERGGHYV
jgi:lactoylglutathione lyase